VQQKSPPKQLVDPQLLLEEGLTHVPSEQAWMVPQTLPQPPQLFGSVPTSTQELPQANRSPVQVVATQVPLMHVDAVPLLVYAPWTTVLLTGGMDTQA